MGWWRGRFCGASTADAKIEGPPSRIKAVMSLARVVFVNRSINRRAQVCRGETDKGTEVGSFVDGTEGVSTSSTRRRISAIGELNQRINRSHNGSTSQASSSRGLPTFEALNDSASSSSTDNRISAPQHVTNSPLQRASVGVDNSKVASAAPSSLLDERR